MKLTSQVVVVTGASRGIGKAVAKLFAREGAKVVVTARSETESERLPGTIHRTVHEIQSDGGVALAIRCDIRHEEQVEAMAQQATAAFGPVDILVNNAAATYPAPASDFPVKRWDVIMDVNLRGTFLCIRAVLPGMLARQSGSILNMTSGAGVMQAPTHIGELPSLGYAVSKAAINKLTINLAKDLEDQGVAVNALWPKTVIATAAVQNLLGGDDAIARCRTPEIMSDAAYTILTSDSKQHSGNFYIDEELLSERGVIDFDKYAITPGAELLPDFFV